MLRKLSEDFIGRLVHEQASVLTQIETFIEYALQMCVNSILLRNIFFSISDIIIIIVFVMSDTLAINYLLFKSNLIPILENLTCLLRHDSMIIKSRIVLENRREKLKLLLLALLIGDGVIFINSATIINNYWK